MKSQDHVILEMIYVKNQPMRLAEGILGPRLKKKTAKRLETAEQICCFHVSILIYKKLSIIGQFSSDILQT